MSTAHIIYKDNLRTEITHNQSGDTIITDAPVDNEGQGAAFSPTDLAAASLAACMITIMGIAAKKREIDMTGTTADVTKIMASDPRRISEIRVDITFPEHLSDKERTILQRASKHCPVGNSLSIDLQEKVNYS
ncbi:MAG TPA: OsmC family protein [Candidatus Marinimicrobia bacterium]|jgi:uncharacterized OsmC-like protein|nr:osmotically inducible protein OsmC [Candidatus Neomarinimicrobiota bacterium]MDP6275500.1 OsmC family protein [Candidatus Neomarinimicrobiota bacterium]MDP7217774.1 OsmC family protein [Candidatus Neomarinimicrobiota bacterium]MDP7436501.1 OsmC family protein [Candidatus Neomarinimicrobiota bacterium]HBN45272.1 osmotically inducible protein OsmC [Candidatus Neomarinimicrobiota bacterium]|tara:strand:+ start:6708 stop:7106 length:399 start_codon:yes stop_codon:yes gene_type:complete